MKVAVLSSASGGGAGIAAYRIYEAIKRHQSDKCEVDFIDMQTMGRVADHVSMPGSATNGTISNTHYTTDFASEVRDYVIKTLMKYDVLNIQWSSYLLTIAEIYELAKSGKRIVFTLHDFYYFTGGCHYPSTCKQYLNSCKMCPQVDTSMMSQRDVEAAHDLKRKIFSFENVILTAPSEYIVNKAIAANIVPKERGVTIRNAYEPVEGKERKQNEDGRIHVLVIADSFYEIRKQLQLAIDGFKVLAESNPSKVSDFVIHLVGRLDKEVLNQLKPYGYKVINHGHKSNHEDIVDVYCQVDYLLTPSLDDNWPNILVESSAYGVVPIVGPGHGCEELVKLFEKGFIFNSYIANEVSELLANVGPAESSSVTFIKSSRKIHDGIEVSDQYLKIFGLKNE
ncbi:glycosyltransferase [Idiomarina sp.]|uniref:glycosyltransferase n=1 Tax=Idiomarina sp. TaxID=1874361 RepID=UPI0025BD6A54|nr:glycosyltransferase [Idiomarina sp.]NQZ03478.1 glycosyltransferase [Idiomarina sp.]